MVSYYVLKLYRIQDCEEKCREDRMVADLEDVASQKLAIGGTSVIAAKGAIESRDNSTGEMGTTSTLEAERVLILGAERNSKVLDISKRG